MIGARIKEERERIGFTQHDFAVAAKAGKRTLSDWEKGNTYPTALQLSALFIIGVDVLYIITGQRSQPVLTHEEQVLVSAYRDLSDKSKKDILLSIIANKGSKETKKIKINE